MGYKDLLSYEYHEQNEGESETARIQQVAYRIVSLSWILDRAAGRKYSCDGSAREVAREVLPNLWAGFVL